MTNNTPPPAPVPGVAGTDPRGLAAAALAFLIWGVLPLYLKQLQGVPALQITAHRLVWACLFGAALLGLLGQFATIRAALADRRVRVPLFASAALVSTNWLVYVWAVTHDRIVEAALGYFINPLVNVLLGVALLSERLNTAQWTAVAIAAAGVSYLAWDAGHLPWISLALAFSFGFYGLVRKLAKVDALTGFVAETSLLAPIGIGYLAWCEIAGIGAAGQGSVGTNLLLVLGGPFTAIPLVLFAYGARRIPYSTVGILQYIGPTIQLLVAVLIYSEPFHGARVAGFSLIWLALAIYASDGLWRSRKIRELQEAP